MDSFSIVGSQMVIETRFGHCVVIGEQIDELERRKWIQLNHAHDEIAITDTGVYWAQKWHKSIVRKRVREIARS
jgi:hypothetical protein